MKQILSKKYSEQPYWPTLKLMLSSLIVFNFYLSFIDIHKTFLLSKVFNLTLIPMFVFIVAFITKSTTWVNWRNNVLPVMIIYFTFQSIDFIPIYFSGDFSFEKYILFPQNGVWFFLATPVWQAIFLLLPKPIKNNKVALLFILALSLIFSYLANDYQEKISGFFAIIYYFPFFVLAYLVNESCIYSFRKKNIFTILCVATLALIALYYQIDIIKFINKKNEWSLYLYEFTTYLFNFLIGILLSSAIVYFSLSTDKYAKVSNNALGIYLIHPIICFILLHGLKLLDIQINFPLVVLLTLLTVTITLQLASNPVIHWFISPVITHKKGHDG
ncbi:TPA: acetyltransferase [Providencia rettgeri]